MENKTGRIEIIIGVLSVVLSVLFLSLIGLSSTQRLPDILLIELNQVYIDLIPHLNAVIISIALATNLLGYRAIKKREVTTHRNYMLITTALFFGFLILYLVRLSNSGLTEFPGPDMIYTYLYKPFLFIHMILASISIPLVLFSVMLAIYIGRERIPDSRHPMIGRIAVLLWGISFVFGLIVYLMLHHVF